MLMEWTKAFFWDRNLDIDEVLSELFFFQIVCVSLQGLFVLQSLALARLCLRFFMQSVADKFLFVSMDSAPWSTNNFFLHHITSERDAETEWDVWCETDSWSEVWTSLSHFKLSVVKCWEPVIGDFFRFDDTAISREVIVHAQVPSLFASLAI